jgi:predicted anti-sigma-YlaC factor YlaD
MDCKETQRNIHLFLKDELDAKTSLAFVEHVRSCKECREELDIEYLLYEGINMLESAEFIDVERELEDKLNRVTYRDKLHKQLKAGLFLLASMIFCIIILGG